MYFYPFLTEEPAIYDPPAIICPRCGAAWYENPPSDSHWHLHRYECDGTASDEHPLVGDACAACAVDAMTAERLHGFLTASRQRLEAFVKWMLTFPQSACADSCMLGRVYALFREHDPDAWLDAARDYAHLHSREALDHLRAIG